MPKRPLYRRTCWLMMVAMLSGGCLLQTTASCGTLAAQAAAGITSSIVGTFVYSSVSEALGLPPTSGYATGLTTGLTGSLLGTGSFLGT